MAEEVYFYRYTGEARDDAYSFDDVVRAHTVLNKYVGVKETPSGWWIVPIWMKWMVEEDMDKGHSAKKAGARWVSNTSRKRFAYPTKEEAWESFCARREWRVRHLKRQLRHAEAIALIPSPTEGYATPSGRLLPERP